MALPRVEIITMWYNEEDFAPFFLRHYAWADKVNLIVDADTADRTVEIASAYPNVAIQYFKFPDGLDDTLKVAKLNEEYSKSSADWVIVVDSDEFVLNDDLGSDVRALLEKQSNANVMHCRLWNVYRHSSERALDASLPVGPQRTHGVMLLPGTQSDLYRKPVALRTGACLRLSEGNHRVRGNARYADRDMPGAHWAKADVDIAVKRWIGSRLNRLSSYNARTGMGAHYAAASDEGIRRECAAMAWCPRVLDANNGETR